MPTLETMITVALAGLALSITPGPSMLYVLSRTVGHGRSAGLASAVGLCLGGVLLAIATAMGLSVVFEQSEWLVTALRYIGSIYLTWLGFSMIRNAKASAEVELNVGDVPDQPLKNILWQGVLVELLNPKTVLFFALFLPPFIVQGDSNAFDADIRIQLLVLGSLVPLTAIPSDLVVAFMGGTLAKTVNSSKRTRERMAWVSGIILIFIAINLHMQLI